MISDVTRRGDAEGAEMLCELAEKLMRSGHGPQARPLWQQARADYPGDVWVYVQAGIEYGDRGDHAGALEWLTTGLELALPVRLRAPVRRDLAASGPGELRERW